MTKEQFYNTMISLWEGYDNGIYPSIDDYKEDLFDLCTRYFGAEQNG